MLKDSSKGKEELPIRADLKKKEILNKMPKSIKDLVNEKSKEIAMDYMDEYANVERKARAMMSREMSPERTELFKETYDKFATLIHKLIKGEGIDYENAIVLVKHAMEIVEDVRENGAELTGAEKSDLAIELLIHVINDLENKDRINPKVAQMLRVILLTPLGPKLIFGIGALASKLKLAINKGYQKLKEKCKGKCCFPN